MAKKAKPDTEAPAAEETSEAVAPVSRDVILGIDAQAKADARKAQEAAAKAEASAKKAADARLQFEIEKQREVSAQARADAAKPSIKVIVQTKKERLVKLQRGAIPSRTQVLVTRRELRRLQGMAQKGAIQLVVGELEKPGDLVDSKTGKPIKGA